MMAVIQDLRASTPEEQNPSSPQDAPAPSQWRFNPCVEIWKRIRLIPPWERHRLLDELEEGSIKNLWKSTMSRYVLDDERAVDLSQGYSIFDDFPSEPGSLVDYVGASEKAEVGLPPVRFFAEEDKRMKLAEQKGKGGSTEEEAQSTWLPRPPRSFKLAFFVHPLTGDIIGRFILPLIGPIEKWWEPPYYLRVKLDLILTPIQGDSGADFTFEFPTLVSEDLNGWLIRELVEGGNERARFYLDSSHLPSSSWPEPKKQMEEVANGRGGSPLSYSPRDYLRAAGPGVYVGCAYRSRDGGSTYNEEDCVYFCIVRRWKSQEEYESCLSRSRSSIEEINDQAEGGP